MKMSGAIRFNLIVFGISLDNLSEVKHTLQSEVVAVETNAPGVSD